MIYVLRIKAKRPARVIGRADFLCVISTICYSISTSQNSISLLCRANELNRNNSNSRIVKMYEEVSSLSDLFNLLAKLMIVFTNSKFIHKYFWNLLFLYKFLHKCAKNALPPSVEHRCGRAMRVGLAQ